jgi:CRISPR-associated endonuclease/helicase Cas3
MHGGYNELKGDHKSGRKEFPNLLQKVDYIVFDEYHLYDESQIANLITLTTLRDIFLFENHKIKYFFVSATPEPGLKTLLDELKLNYTEIIEEIVEGQPKARVIHGKLDVEIVHSPNFIQLVQSKYDEIENVVNNGQKVLIIFDTLIDLQNFYDIINQKFKNYKIVQSSGYAPEDENQNEAIKTANIILATNKAEVGVNYEVEYAIMQPGKFYRNFVQRFGRVSRGDKTGRIIIGLTEMVNFNQFKKSLSKTELSYYEFLEVANSVFQSKKFYNEIIPSLIGEYLWCIQHNLKHQEWFTREFFKERLDEIDFWHTKFYPRYKLFHDINKLIFDLSQKFKNGTITKEWVIWWNNYLRTYYAFRDSSKVVEIYDKKLGIELSYSLEWILQYKEILTVESRKVNNLTVEKYTVGDTKDRDKDIEYHISTIPTLIHELPFIAKFENMRNDKQIQELFSNKISELLKSKKKGLETIDKMQVELLEKLLELSKTFNRKRIKIENIISNDKFI